MNSERALEIFNKVVDIADAGQRLGYLQGACGEDTELLAHVQQLLRAHPEVEDAFPTEPGDRTEFVHVSEGPGAQIGKYKLLQQIGEGGMSVVYMAEQQEPFDRRVALKIIKLGMDIKAVVARFEAERQVLALMNHPNIAKIFDAGATGAGRPYIVMELVKGMPITDYCDKHKLSVEQRLELFIPVCQAIQHAHQKGIIHRDIRPSNVLVALFDGGPVPMVIDFGTAKVTQQRLTLTPPGFDLGIQIEGNHQDVDSRCDIYSLGVLLYELLIDRLPIPAKRPRSVGWQEVRQILKEEPPERPSAAFEAMSANTQTQVARARGQKPGNLIRLLKGDLDSIVMQCLEKDRARRYETASGLAMDLGRFLNGDSLFCPPTLTDRFKKWIPSFSRRGSRDNHRRVASSFRSSPDF